MLFKVQAPFVVNGAFTVKAAVLLSVKAAVVRLALTAHVAVPLSVSAPVVRGLFCATVAPVLTDTALNVVVPVPEIVVPADGNVSVPAENVIVPSLETLPFTVRLTALVSTFVPGTDTFMNEMVPEPDNAVVPLN